MALIAISLQIFWQKFYRNVSWVVLYQPYEFCPNGWILIGCHGNRNAKFAKNIQKSAPQKPWSWNFIEMFITLAATKTIFFIAVAHVLFRRYSFHRLMMGKVEVGLYFYLTADILKTFFRNVPWEVLYQHMNFVQTAEFNWLPWQPKG